MGRWTRSPGRFLRTRASRIRQAQVTPSHGADHFLALSPTRQALRTPSPEPHHNHEQHPTAPVQATRPHSRSTHRLLGSSSSSRSPSTSAMSRTPRRQRMPRHDSYRSRVPPPTRRVRATPLLGRVPRLAPSLTPHRHRTQSHVRSANHDRLRTVHLPPTPSQGQVPTQGA